MEPNPFRKRKYYSHDERNEVVFKKGETIDISQAFQKRKQEIEASTPWHKMKESLISRGLLEQPKKVQNVMKEREAKHREYIIKDSAKQKPHWESFNKTKATPEDKKENKVFKKFSRKETGQEQKYEDNKEFKKFPRKKTGKEQKYQDPKKLKKFPQNNTETMNQDPKKFKKLPQNNTKRVQKDQNNINKRKNKKNIQDFSHTLGKSIKENKQLTFRETKMLKDVITKSNCVSSTRNLESVVDELRSKGLVTTHHLKKIFKVKSF